MPRGIRDTGGRDGQPPISTASRKPPLTVERSPTGWVLRDPALARLAGVEALPLPFTPEATPGEVLAHLRRLNPHREVRLGSAEGAPTGPSPLATRP